MGPGMTERERLSTDTQRLEWLCDTVIGPARMRYESGLPATATGTSSASQFLEWLRHLAPASVSRKRVRIGVSTGSGPA